MSNVLHIEQYAVCQNRKAGCFCEGLVIRVPHCKALNNELAARKEEADRCPGTKKSPHQVIKYPSSLSDERFGSNSFDSNADQQIILQKHDITL